MCGILVYLKSTAEIIYLRGEVKNRGPDYYGKCICDGITFESSVLSLRSPLTRQPLSDNNGILCYNGQIYSQDLHKHDENIQDTLLVQKTLKTALSSSYDLEGEFAFVYYDRSNQKLSFGRDSLGRRSSCYYYDPSQSQSIISSLGGKNYVECDGGGVVYEYSMKTGTMTQRTLEPRQKFQINRSNAQLNNEVSTEFSLQLLRLLRNAVARRSKRPPGDKISLLFSGGLDCTILACLSDQCLEPDVTLELSNVAFENRRTNSSFDTPDRILARRSSTNLQAINKDRFRLTEIDVPYETVQKHKDRVQRLMLPTTTVMDLSIASAFYFAAKPVKNASRILFSGLGADELFAGYSRHTTAAQSSDADRLPEESTMDFSRLPHRNSGRDDRVIATWGRETRYPFLDNGVVDFAMKLPSCMKTDGQSTKIILRDLARRLELDSVVNEKKRAIQFGARSAKMDPGSGAAKGHQTS